MSHRMQQRCRFFAAVLGAMLFLHAGVCRSEDHEFDQGSGITIESLSREQIRNLATLGKVWGFLKYHHPAVTGGGHQWDYELFRVLPGVLAARSRAEANDAMARWVEKLGAVPECTPSCVDLKEEGLQLRPALGWLEDEKLLGPALSTQLRAIYRNRGSGPQAYVILAPNADNARFGSEKAYETLKLPDAGFQLLALYRFWNIVEYWFPNRHITGEKQDKVLAAFVPRLALARSADEYHVATLALVTTAHDSHSGLVTPLDARPPKGTCQALVPLRFIGNDVVVAQANESLKLQAGDVLLSVDGERVSALIRRLSPHYPASNETRQRRDIASNLLRGPCRSTVALEIQRGTKRIQLRAGREPSTQAFFAAQTTHDLPGETFRKLSDRVAYLKLSSVKAADVPGYIEKAGGTEGLIVDIRNYPSDFVVFTLGTRLVEKESPFVRFTVPDLGNPGAFYWKPAPALKPQTPHYAGKVVILVDETSISNSEYTAMALRASPRATVIGSTTAGADGNVSLFTLPGNLRTGISGLGIYYPDKRQTQRIGIVPDIRVTPTVAGLRNGRDEVLEAALRHVLGEGVPNAELRALYRR